MLSKSEHMQHVNNGNTFRGPCFDVVKNVISPPGLSMSKQVQPVNHGRSHIAHVQANQNPTHKRAKRTPAPPNIPDEHVSCTAAAMRNASLQVLFTMSHACQPFRNCHTTLTLCSPLARSRIPSTCDAKASVFYTSHFKICFAPQLRALHNFQKCSEHGVFCTF